MSYAVIKTGGKQYKVKSGEILKIEKLPKNFPIVSNLPEDLDIYLQQKESKVRGIFPNAVKKIYWNKNTKDKTKYSIVFIHGFTTTGYQSKNFLEKNFRP